MKVIPETRYRTKFDIYVFITTHTKFAAILITTVFHHFKNANKHFVRYYSRGEQNITIEIDKITNCKI